VGDLSASIVLRGLPLNRHRALGNVFQRGSSRLARLVVRVPGNEDTGGIGGFADAGVVLGKNSVLVHCAFRQVAVRLLSVVDRVKIDLDKSRTGIPRTFDVVTFNL